MCPNCGSDKSKVSDSRKKDEAIYRIRECTSCYEKYGTIEIMNVDYKGYGKRDKKGG